MADGVSFTTWLALGALALLPLLLMTATSFAKIAVVLSLLRNAFGAQGVPSGAIVTALAAILSAYVMAPVASEMAQRAAPFGARVDEHDPLAGASRAALFEATEAAVVPLSAFLKRNAAARELALFRELAQRARSGTAKAAINPDSVLIVLPAFLLTELSEAFAVGLLVLLPFVVIDLVVGSILLALGMTALSPTGVSLPFKLLLFVLVDGFTVLSRALIASYH